MYGKLLIHGSGTLCSETACGWNAWILQSNTETLERVQKATETTPGEKVSYTEHPEGLSWLHFLKIMCEVRQLEHTDPLTGHYQLLEASLI